MQRFDKEFRTLTYVISKADRILLFAHSRPDPDTVGANLAMEQYLQSIGKHVDIACLILYFTPHIKLLGTQGVGQ